MQAKSIEILANQVFRFLGCSTSPRRPVRNFPIPHPALKGAVWPGWSSFPINRFKNWLIRRAAGGKFPRMAAKLRPIGRQTTPPERAGELPACKAKKQHNFLTGLWKKNASAPCAAEGGCPCLGNRGSQTRETKQHRRRAE